MITLPILETSRQRVTVFEEEDGRVVTKTEKVFSSGKVKWQSRLNYKLRPLLMERLKNHAASYRNDLASIKITEIITDTSSNESLIRADIMMPQGFHDETELLFFDQNGRPLDCSPCFLREDTVSVSDSPQQILKLTQVSIRVGKNVTGFILAVLSTQCNRFIGYAALEKQGFGELKNAWKRLVTPPEGKDYRVWLGKGGLPLYMLQAQRDAKLSIVTLFSIVVPLYNTSLSFFRDMINSVLRQSYGSWELILVNASPENSELKKAVEKYCTSDKRVSCLSLDKNYGIIENTQAGIKAAKGDFLCFLDHDDILEPNALFEYALVINNNHDIDLLYCDEDVIGEQGEPKLPVIKPDFCIDTLRTKNFITHFLSIRASLYSQLEPTGLELEGAQDYDICLKVAEKTKSIHHVPKILYHWRESPSSSAQNPKSKEYASAAGQKALQSHFKRLGIEAEVGISSEPFTYSVKYLFPGEADKQPLVSILIPTKDQVTVLRRCIESLLEKTTYKNYEIILIENNSVEEETFKYYDEVARNERIRLIVWEGMWNYAGINNFGAGYAKGDYLIFLNNDVELISPDWIEQMLGICSRKDVGVVGAKLYYPDNTTQHAGIIMGEYGPLPLFANLPKGNSGYFCYKDLPLSLSAVTAACMMTRSQLFKSLHGFDEDFAIAYNDVDYCFRVRKSGLKIIYSPYAKLYHYESLTRGYEIGDEKQERFMSEKGLLFHRWPQYFGIGDPCLNPNFDRNNPYLHLKKR